VLTLVVSFHVVSGELFVHFASDTPLHRVGFQTAEEVFEPSLTMYFEASSFGLGLNDSFSLAPPLQIHALPSPLGGLLRDEGITTSLIQLPATTFITSSTVDVSVTTSDSLCHCHHLSSGVHYLLGVVNNPHFGHVLANTVSNLFATLHTKRINPKVRVVSLLLEVFLLLLIKILLLFVHFLCVVWCGAVV
jgi:hypothetical protein